MEKPCSVLHVLVCLHTHVYMYMFAYVRATDAHSCLLCDANSRFHLRDYFRVAFSASSAGYGWEGHQYQSVKFCSSRPKYFVPTLMGGDWCYALRTCSPYASICNGITFVRCDGNFKQFPWISPLSAKEENRVRSFASEAVVLHYLILSLRWCMLFSPLCVGCARDARVVIHACVFIHDVSYVSSRQDVCCLTMRCRDKVIL